MPTARTILALDLATTTGVCEGVPGERPRFSHVRFGTGSHVDAFSSARLWIDWRVSQGDLAAVYVESPLTFAAKQGQTNAEVRKRLIGLWAVVSAAVVGSDIKYAELTVANIRRDFIGPEQCRRNEAKARARLMCIELGWDPSTLDEADAGALWWCAVNIETRRLSPVITPMMQAKIASRVENENIVAASLKKVRRPYQARRVLL